MENPEGLRRRIGGVDKENAASAAAARAGVAIAARRCAIALKGFDRERPGLAAVDVDFAGQSVAAAGAAFDPDIGGDIGEHLAADLDIAADGGLAGARAADLDLDFAAGGVARTGVAIACDRTGVGMKITVNVEMTAVARAEQDDAQARPAESGSGVAAGRPAIAAERAGIQQDFGVGRSADERAAVGAEADRTAATGAAGGGTGAAVAAGAQRGRRRQGERRRPVRDHVDRAADAPSAGQRAGARSGAAEAARIGENPAGEGQGRGGRRVLIGDDLDLAALAFAAIGVKATRAVAGREQGGGTFDRGGRGVVGVEVDSTAGADAGRTGAPAEIGIAGAVHRQIAIDVEAAGTAQIDVADTAGHRRGGKGGDRRAEAGRSVGRRTDKEIAGAGHAADLKLGIVDRDLGIAAGRGDELVIGAALRRAAIRAEAAERIGDDAGIAGDIDMGAVRDIQPGLAADHHRVGRAGKRRRIDEELAADRDRLPAAGGDKLGEGSARDGQITGKEGVRGGRADMGAIAAANDRVAGEIAAIDRDGRSTGAPRPAADRAADNVDARREDDRAVGCLGGGNRIVEAEIALVDEQIDRGGLWHRDEQDAARQCGIVTCAGQTPIGRTGMVDDIVRADRHADVEQALVDRQIDLFAGHIGGAAVDHDRVRRLLDDRRDDREIGGDRGVRAVRSHRVGGHAIAAHVDRRAGLDADAVGRSGRVHREHCVGVDLRAAVGRRIARRQQQAADVEGRTAADQQATRGVEPHPAAIGERLAHRALQLGDDIAVDRNLTPGFAGDQDPVEHRIVGLHRRIVDELQRAARGQEIDRAGTADGSRIGDHRRRGVDRETGRRPDLDIGGVRGVVGRDRERRIDLRTGLVRDRHGQHRRHGERRGECLPIRGRHAETACDGPRSGLPGISYCTHH